MEIIENHNITENHGMSNRKTRYLETVRESPQEKTKEAKKTRKGTIGNMKNQTHYMRVYGNHRKSYENKETCRKPLDFQSKTIVSGNRLGIATKHRKSSRDQRTTKRGNRGDTKS